MTKVVYQSMFVFLSALLLAVLFVLTPSADPELSQFQKEIRGQFKVAALELVEGEPVSEPFAFVWMAVSSFYDESATEALALLQPDQAFNDLAMMFNASYHNDLKIASAPLTIKPGTSEPLYNIVPMDENEILLDPYFSEDLAYYRHNGGIVAGESIDIQEEVQNSPEMPPVSWVTIIDSITGHPYCVAIFNASINSYPGYCAEEDHPAQVYEN